MLIERPAIEQDQILRRAGGGQFLFAAASYRLYNFRPFCSFFLCLPVAVVWAQRPGTGCFLPTPAACEEKVVCAFVMSFGRDGALDSLPARCTRVRLGAKMFVFVNPKLRGCPWMAWPLQYVICSMFSSPGSGLGQTSMLFLKIRCTCRGVENLCAENANDTR